MQNQNQKGKRRRKPKDREMVPRKGSFRNLLDDIITYKDPSVFIITPFTNLINHYDNNNSISNYEYWNTGALLLFWGATFKKLHRSNVKSYCRVFSERGEPLVVLSKMEYLDRIMDNIMRNHVACDVKNYQYRFLVIRVSTVVLS